MAQTQIEARAYGPDSSPEEVAAIRARVDLHDKDLILYRELPVISSFSINLCYDRVEELADAHGCRAYIVDARDAGRPDADLRRLINQRMAQLQGRVEHVGVIMDANPLIKVAARFIQATAPLPLSVHDTLPQATKGVRDAIK